MIIMIIMIIISNHNNNNNNNNSKNNDNNARWCSGKEPACQCRNLGFDLGNPMDRRAWWATVHGVARSLTQLTTPLQQCTKESTATFGCLSILSVARRWRSLLRNIKKKVAKPIRKQTL